MHFHTCIKSGSSAYGISARSYFINSIQRVKDACIFMAVNHLVGHSRVVECTAQLLVNGLLVWPLASRARQIEAHQQGQVRVLMRCGQGCSGRFVLCVVRGRNRGAEGRLHTHHVNLLTAKVLLQRLGQSGSTGVWCSEHRNQRGFLHVNVKAMQAQRRPAVGATCVLRSFVCQPVLNAG